MATVYLNSSTGNDSRTYAQAQNIATPRLTLAKLDSSATTGDTCILANGTYTQSASLVWTKSFYLQATTNLSVIFDWNNLNYTWSTNIGGGFIQSTGIVFRNWTVGVSDTGGLFGTGNYRFYNCQLGTSVYPLKIGGQAGFGGLFSGNGGPTNASSCTIVNCDCYIQRNPLNTQTNPRMVGMNSGTSWNGGTGATETPVWTNSTFCFLGTTTGVGGEQIQGIMNVSNGSLGQGGTALTIRDCIFYSPNTAIGWGATANIVFNYSDTYQITSAPSGTGNITGDPLFIDALNQNLKFRQGSPCIDTGL